MKVSITNVHLDLGAGRRGTDMGPSAIHVAGLIPRLQAIGHSIERVKSIGSRSFESLEAGDPSARFLGPITALCRQLADQVESGLEEGLFPLVLGGDLPGHRDDLWVARHYRRKGERIGVVWVDAHTDMNTPETTPTGNIHGMPLAALLGHGRDELLEIMGNEPALDPRHVAIVGARDVDYTEIPLVQELGFGSSR